MIDIIILLNAWFTTKIFFSYQCLPYSRQSPIDILPSELLYDPSLPEFSLTPNKVSGRVVNTGHTVTFQVPTRHYLKLSNFDMGRRTLL